MPYPKSARPPGTPNLPFRSPYISLFLPFSPESAKSFPTLWWLLHIPRETSSMAPPYPFDFKAASDTERWSCPPPDETQSCGHSPNQILKIAADLSSAPILMLCHRLSSIAVNQPYTDWMLLLECSQGELCEWHCTYQSSATDPVKYSCL